MSTPTSLTAGLALGTQLVQGTAASNYITGLMTGSGATPRFDETDAPAEHGPTAGRATVRKARAVRTGYIVPVNAQGRLYPGLIGHELRMLGFKCTSEAKGVVTQAEMVQTMTKTATGGTYTLTFDGQTTAALAHGANAAAIQAALEALSNIAPGDVTVAGVGPFTFTFENTGAYANKNVPMIEIDTTLLTGGTATMAATQYAAGDYYEHVFKLDYRRYAAYGSGLYALDEGAARWQRKVKDIRLSQIEIAATLEGLTRSHTGMGLTEAAAAGSETTVAETAFPLSQAKGSFSILKDAAQLFGAPRQSTLTMTQTLAEDDKTLHTETRAGLPIRGQDITGQWREIEASYAIYKKLCWGGTAGTAPDSTLVEAALDFSYATPANIAGQAAPYLFRVQVPTAKVMLLPFAAEGDSLVYFDVDWQMMDLDPATDPLTITIRNLTRDYVGS